MAPYTVHLYPRRLDTDVVVALIGSRSALVSREVFTRETLHLRGGCWLAITIGVDPAVSRLVVGEGIRPGTRHGGRWYIKQSRELAAVYSVDAMAAH